MSEMDASAAEAEAHDALAHEAEAQDALAHEAEAHEASVAAVLAQEAVSTTGVESPLGSGTRNWSRAAFGFGGSVSSSACCRFSSPAPAEPGAASGTGLALSISAPLTWSGVQSGCSPI